MNEDMPRENASDHDLLIRLDTKVDQLTKDVKLMSDGISTKIASIDIRVNAIEKLIDETQPLEVIKQIKDNTEWISGFKLTWKLLLAVFSTVSLILGAILGSFSLFDKFVK